MKKPVVEEVVNDSTDIEEKVPALSLSLENIRSVGGQKLPKNVPAAPLDNISFHKENWVLKWRFVKF